MHITMKSRARGFSLIEVLVALLVISIGLLGIAKMQALALANTNGGRLRALASIEAASLGASMQADRNYWGNITTSDTITVASTSGTAVVTASSDSTLGATISCPASASSGSMSILPLAACTGGVTCTSTGSACTAQKMAAYDLQQWAGRLQEILGPSAAASIACTVTTPSPPPVSCKITVNWAEQTVNTNAAETSTMAIPSFSLFVTP
jgi:type IV pilus assembly protein PilV